MIALTVNGKLRSVDTEADTPLLWVLRDELELTGTKFGCGIAQCGACTVHVDGVATRSCSFPVSGAVGKKITTIEGLEQNGKLTAVQQAFLDAGAMQCGYCTSGMVMRATALLHELPNPSDAQITTRMNGNICRCGTYPRIVDAVRQAAHSMAKGGAR